MMKIKKIINIFLIILGICAIILPNYCNAEMINYTYENIENTNEYNYIIEISLICVFITYILWRKYGKDEQLVETVEFYPPKGYNSAEIGFLYNGEVYNENIVALLIDLANKGYLQIEETEDDKWGFRIKKLKEYDGNNEYEKIFFDGLFKGKVAARGRTREMVEEAKMQGEKINFLEHIKPARETSETPKYVTAQDLRNTFYETLDKIKLKLNSKENKEKIFEAKSSKKIKWLKLMNILIFILITINLIIGYNGRLGLLGIIFVSIFSAIGFKMIFKTIFSKTNSMKIRIPLSLLITIIIFGTILAGIPWVILILPYLLQNTMQLITYLIGVVCIIIISIFMKIMPKRTSYGNEMLTKIIGFKRFLETSEELQLKNLTIKTPEYFYNILPYAYILGVSNDLIKRFETIAIKKPDWYNSNRSFSVNKFGNFMNSTMIYALNVMSSRPSDNSSSSGNSRNDGLLIDIKEAFDKKKFEKN